jgi:hypothetical protein
MSSISLSETPRQPVVRTNRSHSWLDHDVFELLDGRGKLRPRMVFAPSINIICTMCDPSAGVAARESVAAAAGAIVAVPVSLGPSAASPPPSPSSSAFSGQEIQPRSPPDPNAILARKKFHVKLESVS